MQSEFDEIRTMLDGGGGTGAAQLAPLCRQRPADLPGSTGRARHPHQPAPALHGRQQQCNAVQTGEREGGREGGGGGEGGREGATSTTVPAQRSSIVQILRQMPKLHARVFVFLLTFMKTLLKHSDTNGLEPKVLGGGRLFFRGATEGGLW